MRKIQQDTSYWHYQFKLALTVLRQANYNDKYISEKILGIDLTDYKKAQIYNYKYRTRLSSKIYRRYLRKLNRIILKEKNNAK